MTSQVLRHTSDERNETWLKPPGPIIALPAKEAASTRAALTRLSKTVQAASYTQLRRVCLVEAMASSHIENIHDDPCTPGSSSHRMAQALLQCLEDPDPGKLYVWHHTLLAGHPDPRMTPGRLRGVNVRVGEHVAPRHHEVPELMRRFHQWISQENEPLLRAVWGHRYFETIHPFADGNGRTGRLLIQAVLGLPIAVSRNIWWERSNYYLGLQQGDWQDWSRWFLEIIRKAAHATARDLTATPLPESDNEAIQIMIHPPGTRRLTREEADALALYDAMRRRAR